MNPPLGKRLAAELFGTFCLVFAGCGAIAAGVEHVGVALTFGLVVAAMIYAVGDVSGAHLNPAVTVGFWRAGRFPSRRVAPYLLAQLAGAGLAAGTLRLLHPDHPTLGATLPAGAWWQAFVYELLLTLVLMTVILSVSAGAKEKGITAGLAVGAVVGLEALFAGPVSGASMNPARSLAPAVASGTFDHLWLYLVAPTVGAVLAVPVCRCVREPGCCSPATEGCA